MSNQIDSCSQHAVTCEIYTSFEDLAELQPQWDAFVSDNGADIFLTYDWCRIWWEYYGVGRQLKVYVFRDHQEIIGLMPLFYERVWFGPVFADILKIVGADHSLLQFYLPIQRDCLERVIGEFSRLLKDERWDILLIGPLAGLYPDADRLDEMFAQSLGKQCSTFLKEGCEQIYFHLADSWEQYLDSLSKSRRKDFTRKYTVLEKKCLPNSSGLKVTLADESTFESYFDSFVKMHQEHWQKLGNLGHFGDWPQAYDFHKDIAACQLKRGRLRLMRGQFNDIDIGYDYAYKLGDKYYGILNARTGQSDLIKMGVGTILNAEQMKEAIDEHAEWFDTMRGRYEYKLRHGGQLFNTRKLFVKKKGFWRSLRINLFLLLSRALHLLYYRIWFTRLAPRCPFKRRRSLWKCWIRSRL